MTACFQPVYFSKNTFFPLLLSNSWLVCVHTEKHLVFREFYFWWQLNITVLALYLVPKHNGARLIKSNLQMYIKFKVLYEYGWISHACSMNVNENVSLEALMNFRHHVSFTRHCVLSRKAYSKHWMSDKMYIAPKQWLVCSLPTY